MLCIARLYRKEEADVTVLSYLSTVSYVILFTGHGDTVSSKRSKHNTDHAVHETAIAICALSYTVKLKFQATVNGCTFMLCDSYICSAQACLHFLQS